jgi:phosphomannomutase
MEPTTRWARAVGRLGRRHGATGEALAALTARLPSCHSLLFCEIDGHFPNHHSDGAREPYRPDPRGRCRGAQLRIAFGVVDGKGRILFREQLIQILHRQPEERGLDRAARPL